MGTAFEELTAYVFELYVFVLMFIRTYDTLFHGLEDDCSCTVNVIIYFGGGR